MTQSRSGQILVARTRQHDHDNRIIFGVKGFFSRNLVLSPLLLIQPSSSWALSTRRRRRPSWQKRERNNKYLDKLKICLQMTSTILFYYFDNINMCFYILKIPIATPSYVPHLLLFWWICLLWNIHNDPALLETIPSSPSCTR